MAAGNPALAQMMARQLIGKLAGGGQGGPPAGPGGPLLPPPGMMGQAGPPSPGGPPGGPGAGGPPTPPAGLQLSQQLAELQGADPDATVKGLTNNKSMLVQFYTRSVFTMPGVARNLAQAIKYIDNAIQEAEKAAATTAAAGPIANNAAIQNPSQSAQSQAPVSGMAG